MLSINNCLKTLWLGLCVVSFIICQDASAQPAPTQSSADRATRESDRFGSDTEKKVQRELRRVPQKPGPPKVEEEKPKPGEQKFYVKKIILTGCESYPPEEFQPFIDKYENRDITLTELNNLSREISADYLKKGIIAAVFLPPQEVKEQTVTLQVVEARMGELEIQKSPFYRKKMLNYYWSIKEGEILRYDRISKSLQMMNKNADREVRAALHAGSKPGTTNVILTPKTRWPIHEQYTFDREGIMTTGKERNGLGIRNNNVTGNDDSFIGGLSWGKNFNGIYGYHSLPISAVGTSLLYGYSYSKSTPKKDFAVYSLKSEAQNTTVSLRQDIYRKDDYLGDIYGTFDAKDKVTYYSRGTGTLNRDRLRELTFGGNYVVRGAGSVTYISPEIQQGINALGASKKHNPLSSRPGASPTFTKFTLGLQNRTNLPFDLQQSLKLKIQIPTEKLFSQEQFGLGGIDTVRGYPPSDYLADKMALFNAEMLSPIPFLPKTWKFPYAEKTLKEQLTGVAFFDYGYGETRGNPNPFRLASVGVGLRMSFYNQVMLRLEWGFPLKLLGQDSLSEGKAPCRFHISLNIEDRLPSEIERIVNQMREERMQKEAWALVDAELAMPDSSIRRKLDSYEYLADDLYKQGKLKESREVYALIARISSSLYQQAEKYVKECKLHEEELAKKSEEAQLAYNEGRFDESKRMWEDIIKESVPRPLSFEY